MQQKFPIFVYEKLSFRIFDNFAFFLYFCMWQVWRFISSVSNPRQCVASMGILLGDRYIVVGGAKAKITFWSESAQTGPQIQPLLGAITCLATKENTGNKNSKKNQVIHCVLVSFSVNHRRIVIIKYA